MSDEEASAHGGAHGGTQPLGPRRWRPTGAAKKVSPNLRALRLTMRERARARELREEVVLLSLRVAASTADDESVQAALEQLSRRRRELYDLLTYVPDPRRNVEPLVAACGSVQDALKACRYNRGDFYSYFGAQPEEVSTLARMIFPGPIRVAHSFIASPEESLLLLLARLRGQFSSFAALKALFRRDEKNLCTVFGAVLRHVVDRYEHLLSPATLRDAPPARAQLWKARFQEKHVVMFGAAPSAYYNSVGLAFDGWRQEVLRSVDDMLQNQTYSGHTSRSDLLYGGVSSPDGILRCITGPVMGRHNDLAIVTAELLDALSTLEVHALGDRAFDAATTRDTGVRALLLDTNLDEVNTKEQRTRLSSLRVPIEWAFGAVQQMFPSAFRVTINHLARENGVEAQEMLKSAVLLCNALTCMRGCNASEYFGVLPEPVAEYLRPREE